MTEDNEIESPDQPYNPCEICGYDHDIDKEKARKVHFVFTPDSPFVKNKQD